MQQSANYNCDRTYNQVDVLGMQPAILCILIERLEVQDLMEWSADTDITQTNCKGLRCKPVANCEICMPIISEVE